MGLRSVFDASAIRTEFDNSGISTHFIPVIWKLVSPLLLCIYVCMYMYIVYIYEQLMSSWCCIIRGGCKLHTIVHCLCVNVM